MEIAEPMSSRAAQRTRRVFPVATMALAGIVVLSLAATASAESGTFRSIITYLHDYTSFEFADQTITGGALEGVSTIIESSGGPFVVGAHSRITCMAYAKRSEAGLELESPCVTVDAMGDKQFTLGKRTLGDIGGAGQGGEGTGQLLGGTGKHAGITGICSYETEYLADNWIVTMVECEWERP
ncbi:MAG: hypothetical protein OXC09_07290 [Truepera sp.]|nr:hypothetical protein [Truepera sp.]